jgi:DNA-binding transcriptional MerR regulator
MLLLTVNTVESIIRGMAHPVEREREHKYVGLPEFALAGERILAQLDLEQERGTVTSVPDERTIRYYLAEGLIETPEERQGTASVFGYMNLLQLVAVKKLQAEHLPIRKIRELVSGRSEQELEALLGISSPSTERRASTKSNRESEAKRYLESLLAPTMSQSGLTTSKSGQHTKPQRSGPTQSPPLLAAAAPPEADTLSKSWQRVEIEPRLELHIRSDYSPPLTSAKSRSLADRIRGAISRYWSERNK